MSLVNHQQNSMENQPVLRSILTDSFPTFNNQAESQLMQEVIEQSHVEKNHILYHSAPDVIHVPTGKAMHARRNPAGDKPSITTLNQTGKIPTFISTCNQAGSKSTPIKGTLKQTSCKPTSTSTLNHVNQAESKQALIMPKVTFNQGVSKPTPTGLVTLNQTGSKPTSIVTLPSSNSGINTHGNGLVHIYMYIGTSSSQGF